MFKHSLLLPSWLDLQELDGWIEAAYPPAKKAWRPISYERRTVQPLYYSSMRGKRGNGEGFQALYYSPMRGKRENGEGPGQRVQALHYSPMRGKRGDEEENLGFGPSRASNFGSPGLNFGSPGFNFGSPGEEEGFPRMIRAEGFPYNQWRDWN